jgi:hypothetical protein
VCLSVRICMRSKWPLGFSFIPESR